MVASQFSPLLAVFLVLQCFALALAMNCQPGNFVDGTSCTSCLDNTISTTVNARSCDDCPVRFLANTPKTECELCPAGFFISAADGFDCIPCEVGKYNPRAGATDCITCPDGRITFAMGAKSPLQCGNCPKGFFLLFGETDVTCTFCPSGTYSDEENATFCKMCPTGTFSYVGSPTCTKCPAGTFGVSAADSSGICKRCPDGTYQNVEGEKACRPCPKKSVPVQSRRKCKPVCRKGAPHCRSCAPGRGYNEMKNKCRPCAEGTVSMGRSATGCHPCATGMFPNDSRNRCVCPTGTGFIDGGCRECPFNAEVVNGVKCKCLGDFLLRDGGCLCPSGKKAIGLKCMECTIAEKTELIESFRGPCEYCEAGHFWNETKMRCEACPTPNANPTRNFERSCKAPASS